LAVRAYLAEPVGVLSHHLAMDGGAWDFLRSLWQKALKSPGFAFAGHELFATGGGAVEFSRSALSASDPAGRLWRAAAGVPAVRRPLLLLDVNRWLALILLLGFLLFALFLARTALRHHTRYVLGPGHALRRRAGRHAGRDGTGSTAEAQLFLDQARPQRRLDAAQRRFGPAAAP
jgi:hypothetical protein